MASNFIMAPQATKCRLSRAQVCAALRPVWTGQWVLPGTCPVWGQLFSFGSQLSDRFHNVNSGGSPLARPNGEVTIARTQTHFGNVIDIRSER